LVASAARSALAQPADADVVIRYAGHTLNGGKWAVVGKLQTALDSALGQCGKEGVASDGSFGRGTRAALRRLDGCPGFDHFDLGTGEASDGVVTLAVWRALMPREPMPDVIERGFVIWLTHENTDFDRAEFNFVGNGDPQPNDPGSYLTWGPFGATVGHGREVQKILALTSVRPEIAGCFGDEEAEIIKLLSASDADAKGIVRSAFVDVDRREKWKGGFACLGGKAPVRQAYWDFAFDDDTWLGPALRRLYTVIPDAQTKATAVDFALFVDLAMHVSFCREGGTSNCAMRIPKIRAAIAAKEQVLGRTLMPAERRQVIGQTVVATLGNQVEDRRGRNVVFYVDGLSAEEISDQEHTAWINRSGVRASDVGLSDSPSFPLRD
jgi:hypothetical protein